MKKLLTSGVVYLLIVVGAMAISGCSSPQYRAFYSLSGKYTPENTLDFERGERLARGSNHRPVIFFVPTGTPSPAIALDDAIRRYRRIGPAIALENITIYSRYTFPFIFGSHGYAVHATAILKPSDEHK